MLHHQAQQCVEGHCQLHQKPPAWWNAGHCQPARGEIQLCPRHCATTDLQPDIVIWNSQVIHIFELKVNAAKQKTHLCEACALHWQSSVITLEVGSKGFLYAEGSQKLYSLLCTKSKSRQHFKVKVIREVIASSFDNWCKRNWCAYRLMFVFNNLTSACMSFFFILYIINVCYVPRSPNHTVHVFQQNILAVLGSPSCHLYHFPLVFD